MKKLLLIFTFLILLIGIKNEANGQYYNTGSYYTQKVTIQDRCNGCSCYRAIWHSKYGEQWVYIWNGYNWAYVRRYGWYYWYTWRTYNRCGY